MNTSKCRFCQIKNDIVNQEFDHPIMSNGNYYAIASVGTFIQGWSLIVPKRHIYSMRELYNDSDFLHFADKWIDYVRGVFGQKVIVFEHGANRCGSQTSCGTNHGHLHVVPFEKSLTDAMMKDRNWTCVRNDQVADLVGENEYLLYADIADNLKHAVFYVHILQHEESQYFRRMLSNEVGIKDYSYKTSPHYDDTIESYHKLTRMIG